MRTATSLAPILAALALAACGGGSPSADNIAATDAAEINGMAASDAAAADSTATAANTVDAMANRATAMLRLADGREAGTATAVAENGGITFRFTGMNLPAGTRAVHVHTTGRCDPPGFQSAGGHWNPADRQHGRDNPQGAHAGDIPNLMVGPDGTGTVSFASPGAAMTGANGLLDADGAAIVVHAGADDYRTDPAGNAGDRIACGVLNAG